MPKISDIQETPNPNAVKFILKEPVTNGVARQFESVDKALDDPLAKALFDVGNVSSVFYMDKMITVEKSDESDWDDLLPQLAVPIRAAESTGAAPPPSSDSSTIGGALGAVMSDDPATDPDQRDSGREGAPGPDDGRRLSGSARHQGKHTQHPLSGRMRQLPQFSDGHADGYRRDDQTGGRPGP
jgi:hypothetical protein